MILDFIASMGSGEVLAGLHNRQYIELLTVIIRFSWASHMPTSAPGGGDGGSVGTREEPMRTNREEMAAE
jgi:hypothetical protein